jgi:hypothetical protein
VKLQILKDEIQAIKSERNEKSSSSSKKLKCGQCEKKLAFTVKLIIFLFSTFSLFYFDLIAQLKSGVWSVAKIIAPIVSPIST